MQSRNPEEINPELEQKRFAINPESLEMLKKLRKEFDSQRQRFPFLGGLGFFGSRTKGVEGRDSDLDVFMFYNYNIIKTAKSPTDDVWREYKEAQKIIKESVSGADVNLVSVDLSHSSTNRELKDFVDDVNQDSESLKKPGSHLPLLSRFSLSVGKEVYRNREYILGVFEKLPNANEYLRWLMFQLRLWERGHQQSLYRGYPRTIEEAKKYFLTKPYVF